MSRDLIAWRRWWYPPGDALPLWDGLLLDLDEGSLRLLNHGLCRLADAADLRARVLLGDPGMGKSTELNVEVRRLQIAGEHVVLLDLGTYMTGGIQEAIADAARDWKETGGSGDLVLAMDTFDEPLVDDLSDILARSIDRLDRDRLRVVVASRGSQWSASLGARFTEWWGKEMVGTFALAPLAPRDVAAAAVSEGLDGEEFLSAVRVAGAGPLAARPITLRLMLAGARGGVLPSHRLDVYREGVAGLAAEPNERRHERRRVGLALGRRLEAARRLAVVSILSGRPTIVRRSAPGQKATELALDEVGKEDAFLQALDEVWDSALLTGGNAGRLWCHYSIVEYLCAEELAPLPTDTTWSLLAAPGDPTRLRPQLEETAAWVAAIQPTGMFDRLVETYPRLLLNPDLAGRPSADRMRVGGAVFERLEKDVSVLEHLGTARLDYPGIADDLRPLLASEQPYWRRREAIRLVAAAGLHELDEDLLAITKAAVGRTSYGDEIELASYAAHVLTRTDNDAMIHTLRELAADTTFPGHVRSTLITGLFPDHLTPVDLLTLVAPQDRFTRPLGRSIIHAMHKAVASGTVRAQDALGWFADAPDAAAQHGYARELAATAALAAVAKGPSQPTWLEAVRATRWLVRGPSQLAEWDVEQVERLGPEIRRELSRAVLDGSGDTLLAYDLVQRTLLRADDLLWWLDRLDESIINDSAGRLPVEAAVLVLAELALNDQELLTAARDRCARSGALAAVAEQTLSTHAATAHRRGQDIRRVREAEEAQHHFSQRRLDAALEADDIHAALDELRRHPSPKDRPLRPLGPPGPLPSWRAATTDARERTCALAAAYLAAHEPDLDYYDEIHNLAETITVIAIQDAAQLDCVPPARWTQWLRPLLQAPDGRAAQIALDRALTEAPENVARILSDLIDQPIPGPSHIPRWLLDALPGPILDQAAAQALTRANRPDVDPSTLGDLLAIGNAGRPSEAVQSALEHLARYPAGPDDPADTTSLRARAAAKALITSPRLHEGFNELMRAFQNHRAFALAAIRDLDPWQRHDNWSGLTPDQIGELYLWARTAVPRRRGEPGITMTTDWAEQLPSDLIGMLRRRGDADSARVLAYLAGVTDDVYLRTEAERVRSAVAADAAALPSPQAVLTVLADTSQRAITSVPQLAQVVLAELDAIAGDVLRDRGLRKIFWERQREGTRWDGTYVPSGETDLSERLSRELVRRLKKRVAILREVQIQQGLSTVGGDFIDILTIALTDTTTVALPLEVKGNWHREVITCLRSQLADRYLAGPIGTEGVYVVGYFHSDRWNKEDKERLRYAKKRSIDELRTELATEARAAAADGRTVHVRVLDIPLDLERD